MKWNTSIILATLVLWLSSLSPASGEQSRDTFDSVSKERVEERGLSSKDLEIHELVEMLKETQLVQELELSENKASIIIEKMRYVRRIRKNYFLQRHVIENELHTLLEYASPDQTKIDNTLQKLEIVKLQYYQKLLENDEELRQLLTPEEQARYLLFQRTFNKKLKEVIIKVRQQAINFPQKEYQILRKQPAESVIRQPR